MDLIDEHLATLSLDVRQSAAIRASIGLAKKTLNRYYTKTDDSEVYRIAMSKFSCSLRVSVAWTSHLAVLHPRHKLSYFKRTNWEDAWIRTAEKIVRTEFDCSYATDGEVELVSTAGKSNVSVSRSDNIFDGLAALAAPAENELCDDLHRYLNADVEDVRDPIAWWQGKRTAFPKLSRMALDYLTIPGTFQGLI
jgi:hypothetical protein